MRTIKKHDSKSTWRGLLWVVVFIIGAFTVFVFPEFIGRPLTTTWKEFEVSMLNRHAVERLAVVNKEEVQVYIKKEFANDTAFSKAMNRGYGISAGPHYVFSIGSVETFERKMEEAQRTVPKKDQVSITYIERRGWTDLLGWTIPIIIVLMLTAAIFFRGTTGTPTGSLFSFGRASAKLIENDGKSSVSFDAVAGLDEAKAEIREIVDYLKSPDRYKKLGARIPKGVIIIGPPGTGKTLLAKAVAGEAQVPFFTISGAEFVEMFVGVGASRVRDLFAQAKTKAPCIVFIDEIDAVGRSRGRNAIYSGSNDERESTLNQLLTEMDGFGTNSGVIVLAATNRPDILDPALLRPGRFDRHIYLELPTNAERQKIFQVHLQPLRLAPDVDAGVLASQTPGFSGADIANVCNEGALIAARAKHENVNQEDLLSAIDRIVGGLERKSKVISEEEKKVIAVHESGHAIVSWMLEKADPLIKVSIIPRDRSLGSAWYQPTEKTIQSLTYFEHRLTTALAGRAAEELVFNEVSSGALDDLEKSTKDAYSMVAYLGFSKNVGNISFYDSTGLYDRSFQRPYSEETAAMIDRETRVLVETCFATARKILFEHRMQLLRMAVLLIQKETIHLDDIEGILGKRSESLMRSLPDQDKAGKTDKAPLLLSQYTTNI